MHHARPTLLIMIAPAISILIPMEQAPNIGALGMEHLGKDKAHSITIQAMELIPLTLVPMILMECYVTLSFRQ